MTTSTPIKKIVEDSIRDALGKHFSKGRTIFILHKKESTKYTNGKLVNTKQLS